MEWKFLSDITENEQVERQLVVVYERKAEQLFECFEINYWVWKE